MSWKASAYVKALVVCPNGERISRTEKLVALVLADSHQDKGKAFTYPAVKMIAEDSLMDPRVCRRILASLERKGVIERERGDHQGRGQITFYRFPALDGKGGHGVPLSLPEKEDVVSPFPLSQKEDKRRTEGGRKEDKTAPPHMEEQEQEQVQVPTPPTPSPGEGVLIADGDLGRVRIALNCVIDVMRNHLLNNRPRRARPDLADGSLDWLNFRFGELAVGGWTRDGPGAVLTVLSPDGAATSVGLAKYGKTWERAMVEWFGCGVRTELETR